MCRERCGVAIRLAGNGAAYVRPGVLYSLNIQAVGERSMGREAIL